MRSPDRSEFSRSTRAEADASALERENAALKRTVEDLSHSHMETGPMKMLEQMEAKRALEEAPALRAENAALKRMVEDLAHALRRANAALEQSNAHATAREARRTLDRHGLLRDVDKPEMAKVFGAEEMDEPADGSHYAGDPRTDHRHKGQYGECRYCDAGPGEACHPNCEDRR